MGYREIYLILLVMGVILLVIAVINWMRDTPKWQLLYKWWMNVNLTAHNINKLSFIPLVESQGPYIVLRLAAW